MSDVTLFAATDLTTPLGRVVSDDKATHAERIVWGWLKPALGLDVRPTPVPDEVYAWSVELGCIYIENPSGLASYQLSQERLQFSSERRAQILAEVERVTRGQAGPGSADDGSGPHGSFPPAPAAYPDPARRSSWSRW